MSSHCLLMGLNFIGAGYAPNTGLPVCFRVRTESLRVRSINSISKKKAINPIKLPTPIIITILRRLVDSELIG